MRGLLKTEQIKSLAPYIMLAYVAMLTPTDAFAADGAVLGDLLCNVVSWFTGSVGKGIATLGIIVLGIGALMGKVSHGNAIIVALGVATIFGANDIVGELSPAGGGGCYSDPFGDWYDLGKDIYDLGKDFDGKG